MFRSWIKARRQIKAMRKWCGWTTYSDYDWSKLLNKADKEVIRNAIDAEGYFLARDWVGVESCYLACRRILDKNRNKA